MEQGLVTIPGSAPLHSEDVVQLRTGQNQVTLSYPIEIESFPQWADLSQEADVLGLNIKALLLVSQPQRCDLRIARGSSV